MRLKKIIRLTRKELTLSPQLPSILVFVALLVIIGTGWRSARQEASAARDNLISETANTTELNTLQKVLSFENALMASRGFLESSENVDSREWKQFVGSLNLASRKPGLLGIGYAEFDPNKSDPDNFTSTVEYIELIREIENFDPGDKLSDNNKMRRTMVRSASSGEPRITSLIAFDDKPSNESIITLFLPLYDKSKPLNTDQDRAAAVKSFVFAPIDVQKLFESVFKDVSEEYNFRIYDVPMMGPENVIYLHNSNEQNYEWVKRESVIISGREWIYEFGVKDTVVPDFVRNRQNYVLIGGLILASIVTAIVYLLLQKRAESLSDKQEKRVQQAKDNMLSLASHQLRTPATGVKQYIGMVLEGFTGTITKDQRRTLQYAYDSNERQLRIINEFLYMAKADAKRIVITPQRFELVELVKDVAGNMKTEVREAGHKLKITTKKSKIYTYGDTHSIRMIIENLISNAIKYTPPGGRIEVNIKNKASEVAVEVTDNGVGIAAKDFPKLFQQFSRIANKRTKETSGSGIGLYLSKVLAELNKGYITVKSEPGEGSVFTLHLLKNAVKNLTEKAEKDR